MADVTKQVLSTPRPVFFHPYSGLIILGLDWLLFSSEFVTLGTAELLTSFLGFVLGGVAVSVCQRVVRGDSWRVSLTKGFFGGVVVGLPFPVAGTFLGGAILTMSGLSSLKHYREETQGPGTR